MQSTLYDVYAVQCREHGIKFHERGNILHESVRIQIHLKTSEAIKSALKKKYVPKDLASVITPYLKPKKQHIVVINFIQKVFKFIPSNLLEGLSKFIQSNFYRWGAQNITFFNWGQDLLPSLFSLLSLEIADVYDKMIKCFVFLIALLAGKTIICFAGMLIQHFVNPIIEKKTSIDGEPALCYTFISTPICAMFPKPVSHW